MSNGAPCILNGGTSTIEAATKPGAMLRAGFEAGHFRMAIEYNFVGSTKQDVYDNSTGNTVESDFKTGYLGIRIGVAFGGKRY